MHGTTVKIFWGVSLFSKFRIKFLRPSPSSQHCGINSQVGGYALSGFSHEVFSNDDLLGYAPSHTRFLNLFFWGGGGNLSPPPAG